MSRRRRTAPAGKPGRRPRAPAPSVAPAPALGRLPAGHRVALAALIAAYAITFSILSWIRWRYYLYTDFDLAIFSQAIDGVLRGTLFSSIRGMAWLGDHSSLILFPLAPLYAVFRHPMTLLVVQSTALALGALPIHALARRELRHDGLALACAALYLLQPAMGYANLFEFHPEMLATPLLAAAFFSLRSGRTAMTVLSASAALLCREDVALVVGFLGLYALLWNRPRRPALALGLFAASAASLALTFLVLRPAFTHGESDYAGVYQQWGTTIGSVIGGVLSRPDLALQCLVVTPGSPIDTAIKLQYHLTMFLPLAFLPFASPASLLIALPAFAEHLLSWRTPQHTILCQYTALILPFTAAATVIGMRNLLTWLTPRTGRAAAVRALAIVPLAASLACAFLYGPLLSDGKFLLTPTRGRRLPTGAEVAAAHARDRLLTALPKHGAMVASFEMLPHLSGRDSVHSLHHVMTGRYTFSSRPYPMPSGVTVVVADLAAPGVLGLMAQGTTERLITLVSANRLVAAREEGDLVRFERLPREVVPLVSAGSCDAVSAPIVFDGQLAWRGGGVADSVAPAGGSVRIETCWQRTGISDRFHGMELTLVDAEGKVVETRRRDLGYLVEPPLSWPPGILQRETYRMLLDADLKPGVYTLRMKVVWRGININGVSESDAPDRYDRTTGALLGRITIANSASR